MIARHGRGHGFTLIELLIAVALALALLLMALPTFATWIADQQIRAATESIATGLRLAHSEAIRRNWQVEFVIDPTPASGGWTITPVGESVPFRAAHFAEGSDNATFTRTPGTATTVTFDGLGRVVTPNADASPILTAIRIEHPVGDARTLMVLVGGGRSGIKICDPAVTDTDSPRYCTAAI